MTIAPAVHLAARCPADLAAALKRRARTSERTVSAEIRVALRSHLDRAVTIDGADTLIHNDDEAMVRGLVEDFEVSGVAARIAR